MPAEQEVLLLAATDREPDSLFVATEREKKDAAWKEEYSRRLLHAALLSKDISVRRRMYHTALKHASDARALRQGQAVTTQEAFADFLEDESVVSAIFEQQDTESSCNMELPVMTALQDLFVSKYRSGQDGASWMPSCDNRDGRDGSLIVLPSDTISTLTDHEPLDSSKSNKSAEQHETPPIQAATKRRVDREQEREESFSCEATEPCEESTEVALDGLVEESLPFDEVDSPGTMADLDDTLDKNKQSPLSGKTAVEASNEMHNAVWQPAVDSNTGRMYYFNRFTRVTTWKKPTDDLAPLARQASSTEQEEYLGFGSAVHNACKPLWMSALDPKTNKTYYHNRVTYQTSWTKPAGFEEQHAAYQEAKKKYRENLLHQQQQPRNSKKEKRFAKWLRKQARPVRITAKRSEIEVSSKDLHLSALTNDSEGSNQEIATGMKNGESECSATDDESNSSDLNFPDLQIVAVDSPDKPDMGQEGLDVAEAATKEKGNRKISLRPRFRKIPKSFRRPVRDQSNDRLEEPADVPVPIINVSLGVDENSFFDAPYDEVEVNTNCIEVRQQSKYSPDKSREVPASNTIVDGEILEVGKNILSDVFTGEVEVKVNDVPDVFVQNEAQPIEPRDDSTNGEMDRIDSVQDHPDPPLLLSPSVEADCQDEMNGEEVLLPEIPSSTVGGTSPHMMITPNAGEGDVEVFSSMTRTTGADLSDIFAENEGKPIDPHGDSNCDEPDSVASVQDNPDPPSPVPPLVEADLQDEMNGEEVVITKVPRSTISGISQRMMITSNSDVEVVSNVSKKTGVPVENNENPNSNKLGKGSSVIEEDAFDAGEGTEVIESDHQLLSDLSPSNSTLLEEDDNVNRGLALLAGLASTGTDDSSDLERTEDRSEGAQEIPCDEWEMEQVAAILADNKFQRDQSSVLSCNSLIVVEDAQRDMKGEEAVLVEKMKTEKSIACSLLPLSRKSDRQVVTMSAVLSDLSIPTNNDQAHLQASNADKPTGSSSSTGDEDKSPARGNDAAAYLMAAQNSRPQDNVRQRSTGKTSRKLPRRPVLHSLKKKVARMRKPTKPGDGLILVNRDFVNFEAEDNAAAGDFLEITIDDTKKGNMRLRPFLRSLQSRKQHSRMASTPGVANGTNLERPTETSEEDGSNRTTGTDVVTNEMKNIETSSPGTAEQMRMDLEMTYKEAEQDQKPNTLQAVEREVGTWSLVDAQPEKQQLPTTPFERIVESMLYQPKKKKTLQFEKPEEHPDTHPVHAAMKRRLDRGQDPSKQTHPSRVGHDGDVIQCEESMEMSLNGLIESNEISGSVQVDEGDQDRQKEADVLEKSMEVAMNGLVRSLEAQATGDIVPASDETSI